MSDKILIPTKTLQKCTECDSPIRISLKWQGDGKIDIFAWCKCQEYKYTKRKEILANIILDALPVPPKWKKF